MIKHFCSGRVEIFCLRERIHLGDTVIAMNMIYNLCRQERFSAVLHAHNMEVVRQIMGVFDYEGLIVPGIGKPTFGNEIKFGMTLQVGEFHDNNWCGENFGTTSLCLPSLRRFDLPLYRVRKSHVTRNSCFQMHGNSEQWNKPRLKAWETEAFLRLFCDGESVQVGGPKDSPMQGYRTHLSDIGKQCEFMLGCRSFKGVDSGMSHLAGTLGMEGDVVVQAEEEGYFRCVEKSFNFMYPKLRIHSRRSLGSYFAGGSIE